jgi:hypothetical protein
MNKCRSSNGLPSQSTARQHATAKTKSSVEVEVAVEFPARSSEFVVFILWFTPRGESVTIFESSNLPSSREIIVITAILFNRTHVSDQLRSVGLPYGVFPAAADPISGLLKRHKVRRGSDFKRNASQVYWKAIECYGQVS